jgi:hypothetical protein
LTFSHADEARVFILGHQLHYYKNVPIDAHLKARVDHSTMDLKFFLQNARNEAQTVKEIEQVRKAREELRQFEKEMDSHMPNRERIYELQRFAKSLIQDDKASTMRQP